MFNTVDTVKNRAIQPNTSCIISCWKNGESYQADQEGFQVGLLTATSFSNALHFCHFCESPLNIFEFHERFYCLCRPGSMNIIKEKLVLDRSDSMF